MKAKLTEEFTRRIRRVLDSGLNSKNTVRAINTFAIPVLDYSFGIVGWSKTDADALQRKIRVLMTKYRKHHPKSSADRTMLPRHMGGKGLIDIDNYRVNQVYKLRQYFHLAAASSELHDAICEADDATHLRLSDESMTLSSTSDLQRTNTLTVRPLYGRHPNETSQDHLDFETKNY